MSESGDTGEGPDDREAKRRKSSDPKQQQEEEKSIPPKGNESSSTANPSVKENTGIEQKPEEAKTEGSSGAQGSSEFERRIEQRIEQVFGRENIPRPVLPLKKRELHPTPRGYDPNLVVSLSESGQPELGRQLEQLENQPERLGRQPELPWSTEDPAVVLATIAALIAIAGVKFQNASDNPFHSRPATMTSIFIALLIYGFAAAQTRPIILDGKQQKILMWRIIYYFYRLLNSLILISKVVCQACIVSLFIPYGLGWNVYVACASTSCFGVAVWAILRNFAPSCVVRLVPCMGPIGSSGGSENNDGDSDSGNDGRNRIEESNASPVCGSSVVSENQSSSQQGGTSSSVPSHQTDHSTQADGKTANTGNAVLLHIIQSSPHKGTESEAHPNPDEKPIQSPKPLEVASQRSQAGPV